MKNAVETITEIIRNKVWHMNQIINQEAYAEAFERFRHELNGMLICLKNIETENKFYCTNFFDDYIEFGYYDEEGKWNIIDK